MAALSTDMDTSCYIIAAAEDDLAGRETDTYDVHCYLPMCPSLQHLQFMQQASAKEIAHCPYLQTASHAHATPSRYPFRKAKC
eukprot:scaffold2532_cov79-Skeletonema_menzelii.AAC.18